MKKAREVEDYIGTAGAFPTVCIKKKALVGRSIGEILDGWSADNGYSEEVLPRMEMPWETRLYKTGHEDFVVTVQSEVRLLLFSSNGDYRKAENLARSFGEYCLGQEIPLKLYSSTKVYR